MEKYRAPVLLAGGLMPTIQVLKTIIEILAQNIKSRRKELKLTQPQMAERCNVPFRTYQTIEMGQSWPEKATLDLLIQGLDVDPSSLFIDPDRAPEITPEQALKTIQKLLAAQRKSQS